jgi:hypothetical protein
MLRTGAPAQRGRGRGVVAIYPATDIDRELVHALYRVDAKIRFVARCSPSLVEQLNSRHPPFYSSTHPTARHDGAHWTSTHY